MKYIYACYLNLVFYCLNYSAMFNHNSFCCISAGFITPNSRQRFYIFKSSNATGVWKRNEHRDNWILINAYWVCLEFALDLLDIHLLDINLSDANWNWSDGDIYSFSVNILLVFKMSWRPTNVCWEFFRLFRSYL